MGMGGWVGEVYTCVCARAWGAGGRSLKKIPTGQKKKRRKKVTASVQKQDPVKQRVQKNAIYEDKTQHANFRGNSLYQATKRHLNNS